MNACKQSKKIGVVPYLLRMVLVVIALIAGMAPWWTARDAGREAFPGFIVRSIEHEPVDELPAIAETVLNPEAQDAKAHSAALVEMGDGRLIAVWYAGSSEGDADVGIFAAVRPAGGVWEEPHLVLSREMVSESLGRFVLSLGNPILITDDAGRLGMVFVSIAAGKWSGSSLNLVWSEDGGETWGAIDKLTLNPLFNLAALPRNPPVPLVGGGWAIPIYEELIGNFPEILWLRPRDTAATAAVSRMAGGLEVMQPALVALTEKRAVGFYRDITEAKRMREGRSDDAGKTWTAPAETELPNPNSGVCVVRLPDGRLLCAFNDVEKKSRENLRLAISRDEGRTWQRIATLAEEEGQEFSYPYILIGGDEWVRIVYSSRKNRIAFVEFNMEWINSQEALATERKEEAQ